MIQGSAASILLIDNRTSGPVARRLIEQIFGLLHIDVVAFTQPKLTALVLLACLVAVLVH